MSKWSSLPLRAKGIIVIALPLVPLLGTLGVLLQIRRIETRRDERVDRVREVQSQADRLLATALDAETGMRGYLISENERFLEPYYGALEGLPQEISALRAHADPRDANRVNEIEELVTEQLRILASLRLSERGGLVEGSSAERKQASLLDSGKEKMDELRAVVAEHKDHEEQALDEAIAAEESARLLLDRVAFTGVAVGAIGGIASLLLLLRGIVAGVREAAVNARGLSQHRAPSTSARRGDELGALADSLEEAYLALSEQERRRAEAEQALHDANFALEERVRERTSHLQSARLENLQRLALAAEYRDDNTHEHTQRVAETTALLAAILGLPRDEVEILKLAAPLHDVGKIGIPDSILLKPGRLTPDEFETMKTHTEIGAKILSGSHSPILRVGEVVAATHHERWNGSGYPHGLSGEHIPLAGRILAVADVLDALTHERPYKRAWTLDEALDEIVRQRGEHFDPAVVDALLRFIRPAETGDRAAAK